MRWVLVLALVCSASGCRKSQPPAQAQPAPAVEPAPAPAPAPASSPAEAAPARTEVAAAAPAPSHPAVDTLPVADVPPPAASPANPDEEHDKRVYAWEDEQGVVHYGTVDDVPEARRKSARVVDAGVTVVEPNPVQVQPSSTATITTQPAEDSGEQPAERKPPGEQPELDAQGLPIPGTMQDTAATRASKASGETQIDPAAVERRRQEELRRMNCKEKDGVWTCG